MCKHCLVVAVSLHASRQLRSVSRPSTSAELLSHSFLTKQITVWATEVRENFDRDFILYGLAEGFKIIPENVKVGNVNGKTYASSLTQEEEPILDELFSSKNTRGKTTPV